MSKIESNVYLIGNPEELNCDYVLYKVVNLSQDLYDYDKNVQTLTNKMTRYSKAPCVATKIDGELFLAHPSDAKRLPEKVELVRSIVSLVRKKDVHQLRFDQLDSETSGLATGFLYSIIRNKLRNNRLLWQPSTGGSFFFKTPDDFFKDKIRNIDVHQGFSVRPILLSDYTIGICVDVHSKYIARYTLPTDINRDNFTQYQGIRCLYEYGNRWYEININGLQDSNVSELEISIDGKNLFDHVHDKAGSHKSQSLRELPKDCSVLFYYTREGEIRNVPSGLCRRVYGTWHPEIQSIHRYTRKPPHVRRKQIKYIVARFFSDLHINNVKIRLQEPLQYPEEQILLPDLEFSNNKVLSVRGTGSENVEVDEYPRKKKSLLYSESAGIYTKKLFDKQYIIFPKSVLDTFGENVIADIKSEVNKIFINNVHIVYDPIIIAYDDSVQKSVPRIGKSILDAIKENDVDYGYGLVMIPELPSKRMIKEDELANLVLRESRKRRLFVSIMHIKTSKDSYDFDQHSQKWRLSKDSRVRSTYRGYIHNVVLNKILLLSSYWPFILKTRLNSDLVIGIDVKGNTTGFTVIPQSGEKLRFIDSTSDQKEQLSRDHLRKKIHDIIVEEQRLEKRDIKNIVIHRQGTLFPGEKEGIQDALNLLSSQGIIDKNFTCTFVEIRSSSRMRYRLFKVEDSPWRQEDYITNPEIGTYRIITENEAFICNTGTPYKHGGTTNPLHILKHGHLPIKEVIEDVFYLSNLTWTKIDDCSRLPISVKFADIRLRESAGDYDSDALRFDEEV